MKNFKFALLAIAIAGSSMAMAQDKPAMVKQFLDLQRPGIEALARGLVEQSSAPIAQAGSQYLQTQSPPRSARPPPSCRRRAQEVLRRSLPHRARQGRGARAGRARPDPARQLQRRRTAPAAGLDQLAPEQEVPGTQPQDADRADGKAGGRDPLQHRAENAHARRQCRQGPGGADGRCIAGQVSAQAPAKK